MRMAVPPNGNCVMFQAAKTNSGITAITIRKIDPGSVIRFSTCWRYRSVGGPGRMPGMNPPCLRMTSACCCGLKAIAV